MQMDLKILTEGHDSQQSGLRLSYATLGAFMKYPKSSFPHKPTAQISDKKYGFFHADSKKFEAIANDLGLVSKGRKNQNCLSQTSLIFFG